MNRFPIVASIVAAVSLSYAAASSAIPSYQGAVSAVDYSVTPLVINRAGTTTSIPAAYLIAAGGGTHAESLSQSIDNGTVEATATSGFNGVANAFTEIRYLMTLVALPGAMTLPNGRVPVRFVATGEADAHILSTGSPYGAAFNASAAYEALFDNQTTYIEGSASAGSNGFGGSFLLDQIVQLLPGAEILVIINASASAGVPGGDAVLAHAFVDPQYLIDPAYAAYYYFDGLPVAAVPPGDPGGPIGVPEPGTSMLLVAGVGALAVRRSSRGSAAPRSKT